ncbi:MAG: DUF1846 domain-containing protein [Oscillospiraceae bacterium]|jgi:uncharacterized protein (UPF0371 family)|nr:DUF1846 domain-containing protein [Oscillospiraceae bacterium]
MKIGFDKEKYLSLQSELIMRRVEKFGGKLYLEFGGKLFDDFHASRVLPGFSPDSKIKMLHQLKDKAELVIVINAADIEKNKVRGDLGITYDLDVLRLIDAFQSIGMFVGSVVLNKYHSQPAADVFQKRLQSLGVKVYRHYPIEGYPSNVPFIVSDDGYGKNEYIQTSRSLVVVTAPGPGSGKMAACLSQLYHDHKRGIKAGYAKFETFPVWNLALTHPVNIAYEAATADLNDVNMIDPFHLEAYGETAVNYNRDIEIFPVLNSIFEKIWGCSPYKSPTDMGVNMAGKCIIDDESCRTAAEQEIIRRYYSAVCEKRKGLADSDIVYKLELLMKQAKISSQDRQVVKACCDKASATNKPATAIMLDDGRIITGKTTSLLGASSAMLLNALKTLADIPDEIHLIPPLVIEPIQKLKTQHLDNKNPRLHTDEVLIALSISAATDKNAEKAIRQLYKLRGCEAHSSVILSQVDDAVFKKLGVNITCEPQYESRRLFHK